MGIFLVIVIIIALFWPAISRWLRLLMARRAEDFIRRATGMPPRPGSREERRRQRASSGSGKDSRSDYGSRRQRRRQPTREPLIPKEYAEDVEFTETISYSETIIVGETGKHTEKPRRPESQVSDAEWTDLP